MGQQFILPDLGEGLTEAEIVSWLVKPGDTISIDQPVVEVESAKSVVELPSPFGGVIEKLHADAGATVHAGQPLLTMAGDTTSTQDTPDIVPGTAVREVPDATDEGSGAVLIGYGTQARKRGPSKAGSGRFGTGKKKETSPKPAAAAASGPSPVVSPLVRRLAREHGFNASDLAGSGPN